MRCFTLKCASHVALNIDIMTLRRVSQCSLAHGYHNYKIKLKFNFDFLTHLFCQNIFLSYFHTKLIYLLKQRLISSKDSVLCLQVSTLFWPLSICLLE